VTPVGRTLDDRLAGAPISWGVCEVSGWGAMPSVETVLSEMEAVGLHRTELGAPGFLPTDPDRLTAALEQLTSIMAGGAELEQLSDKLQGISSDPRVAKELAAVREAGVLFQIGFNRRFDPAHASVRDAVASGTIGEPHLVRISSRDPAPPPLSYVKTSGGCSST
jgi:hypothetical protein